MNSSKKVRDDRWRLLNYETSCGVPEWRSRGRRQKAVGQAACPWRGRGCECRLPGRAVNYDEDQPLYHAGRCAPATRVDHTDLSASRFHAVVNMSFLADRSPDVKTSLVRANGRKTPTTIGGPTADTQRSCLRDWKPCLEAPQHTVFGQFRPHLDCFIPPLVPKQCALSRSSPRTLSLASENGIFLLYLGLNKLSLQYRIHAYNVIHRHNIWVNPSNQASSNPAHVTFHMFLLGSVYTLLHLVRLRHVSYTCILLIFFEGRQIGLT